jgi:hypothetical protein
MNHLKVLLISLLLAACGPSEKTVPLTEQVVPVPFKLAGDVKHTMQWVLDPAADHVWDSAGSIITAEGTQELAPTTDEGWLAVQHSAAVIAETGNLLVMPGRAVDNEAWQDISLGLVAAGLRAQSAAAAKDADELFDAGGQIYRVCSSCHSVYVQGEDILNAP